MWRFAARWVWLMQTIQWGRNWSKNGNLRLHLKVFRDVFSVCASDLALWLTMHMFNAFIVLYCIVVCAQCLCLQCFDAVDFKRAFIVITATGTLLNVHICCCLQLSSVNWLSCWVRRISRWNSRHNCAWQQQVCSRVAAAVATTKSNFTWTSRSLLKGLVFVKFF